VVVSLLHITEARQGVHDFPRREELSPMLSPSRTNQEPFLCSGEVAVWECVLFTSVML